MKLPSALSLWSQGSNLNLKVELMLVSSFLSRSNSWGADLPFTIQNPNLHITPRSSRPQMLSECCGSSVLTGISSNKQITCPAWEGRYCCFTKLKMARLFWKPSWAVLSPTRMLSPCVRQAELLLSRPLVHFLWLAGIIIAALFLFVNRSHHSRNLNRCRLPVLGRIHHFSLL